MHFRAAILQTSVTGFPIFQLPGGLSQEISLNLASQWYFPPYIYNFVRLFQKVKVLRCVATYEPRCATGSTASFVLASPKDIEWVEFTGQTLTGTAFPTEAGLVSLSNACSTVCYGRCRVPVVPMADRDMLFVNNDTPLNSQINYATTSSASLRQSIGGQLLVSGVGGNVGINFMLGDIYFDMEFMVADYTTAPVTNTFARETKVSRETKSDSHSRSVSRDAPEPRVQSRSSDLSDVVLMQPPNPVRRYGDYSG